MIKLTCGAQTALNILMVCNFYADNDCHNILSDDTARRMIKTVVSQTSMSPVGICTIKLHESDCVDLKLLLSRYENTIANGNEELLAILAQMDDVAFTTAVWSAHYQDLVDSTVQPLRHRGTAV